MEELGLRPFHSSNPDNGSGRRVISVLARFFFILRSLPHLCHLLLPSLLTAVLQKLLKLSGFLLWLQVRTSVFYQRQDLRIFHLTSS